MFGVVIIAYKRPELLTQILQKLEERESHYYILVDRDPDDSEENLKCRAIALDAATKDSAFKVNFPNVNLGPGRAVPAAISWAFEMEESLLVLEDDCIPTEGSFDYFQQMLDAHPNIGIICGSSPFDFKDKTSSVERITTSKYALVSGWVIRKATWVKLEIENRDKYSYLDIVKSGLKNPRNIVKLSFFYASMIRVRANLAQAWDSFLCFSMLINKVHSIIPNVTLISNLGFDLVASNTRADEITKSNIYQAASAQKVAEKFDGSDQARRITDKEFEKSIYRMKVRHLLSPLKSFILSR